MSKKNVTLTSASPQTLFWLSVSLLIIAIFSLGAALWVQRGGLDAEPPQGYAIGSPVRFNQSVVTVKNVTKSNGTGRFSAPKGSEYIVITVQIKNIAKQSIMVLPSLDMYLKDEQGRMTYMSPNSLEHPLRSGPVLSGDTVQGQISYLVPMQTEQSLYIDATWTGGVAKFAL